MGRAGKLRDRVAFDAPSGGTDVFGGKSKAWIAGDPVSAELIYQRGDEAVQAARLAGRQVLKVRVRASQSTRAITTDHRMRDVRRDHVYNVLSVDAVTDRSYVWLQVEGPVIT